ncbi:MAG: glycerate kinase [Acetobacteraceae bacterium]|nr:glycerate kinase [Acetobacteraceae bacterium]
MRVMVAPGAFKGSLSALEAARAMEAGVLRAVPGCRVVRVPLADGGEGTVTTLVASVGGQMVAREVTGPLGTKVQAYLGLLTGTGTGVVEAAQAAGLTLVPPGRANPMRTTSYGVGELMRMALDAGCGRLVVGLGDSGTVDGGLGALQALGARFLDGRGELLKAGGGELARLRSLDLSGLDPRLARTQIVLAVDVDNPLLGPRGAARAFGPQKGATPGQVEELERGLAELARVIEAQTGRKVGDLPGGGAAGGLGAGLAGVLGAQVRSGADLVLEATDLGRRLGGVDLVLTGEGRLDSQTLRGKVVLGVAARARRAGVPVVAVVGSLGEDAAPPAEYGLDAVFSACPGPVPLAQAMEHARELLAGAVEQVMRVLALGRRLGQPRT